MDAKDHSVIAVLSDQKRFMVPIYQRQYAWGAKQWDDFWSDVVAKAEEVIEGKALFQHYMGALILAPGTDGYVVASTPKVQVVDGQQRLTTFQIFLAALREVGSRQGFPEVAESVQNYIYNRLLSGDKDDHAKYKLMPTPADRQVFHTIMDGSWKDLNSSYPDAFYQNGNLKAGSSPKPIQALSSFIDKIESYVSFGVFDPEEERVIEKDDDEICQKRLHALLEALLNRLKLVVITLDEKDDAQVIFETLNSKAEPLLAMDLVRNNIFHRAEAQGEAPEKLFETRWKVFDSLFWKADSPRAKPRRPRIDHFLSHALAAQTGKEISLRELYAEYRAYTRPNGRPRFATVEGELDALIRFTGTYVSLENGGETNDPIGWLGSKLTTWEVTTAYPLIFCVAASDAPQIVKVEIYKKVYSYIVRRSICGLTPKGLNKTFQRVTAELLKAGVSTDAFNSAFAGQAGVAVRFPSDDEFISALSSNPVYEWFNKKERLADVLWELELRKRNKYSVSTARPFGMSIEHVLPQAWAPNWPLADGRQAPSDYINGADKQMLGDITRRKSLLHTIGNLTLVTVPANSAASNSGFTAKKDWLKKSLLALNLEIASYDNWSEEEILARSASIAEAAIKIWPS